MDAGRRLDRIGGTVGALMTTGSEARMFTEDYRDIYQHGAPYDPRFEVSADDRITHLVMLDGRLVDVWTEPAVGSRWQEHADRFDRERRFAVPPPEPLPPTFERALSWLDDVCGGRAAVLALTADPLLEDGLELPDLASPHERSRTSAVAELLDAVADRRFDLETSFAFRAALLRVHATEPEVVSDAASAGRAAGGIVWAVGKANGLLRPQGETRIGLVQEALGLTTSPTGYGKVVERALVGYRDRASQPRWRPDGLPDLLALGCPDLLVGAVRRRLVRVRDRALEAQAAASAA